MKKVLVTGAAGFIGFHLCKKLLCEGYEVLGLDCLNEYYDPTLKQARLNQLQSQNGFKFFKMNLEDRVALQGFFDKERPPLVVNLAAQAGVRYSLSNPHVYVESNIVGFLNILENCRNFNIEHLVYASSSSVYGLNTQMPFTTSQSTDHPVSLYAATKKANEMMAHSYSHLYKLPTTGLRFFTVYGPWGRPDMALFLFCKAIMEGRPIDVYNNGMMKRDFTYIDDIVEGMIRLLRHVPVSNLDWDSMNPNSATSSAPYKIYNIGNHQPTELLKFISIIENCLGRKANKILLPMQSGDVPATYAEVDDLMEDVGFKPDTPLEVGIARFVDWYQNYYGSIRKP